MNYIEPNKSTRILSIDFGNKRIGLAISDIMKVIAKPYKTIKNLNDNQIIESIREVIIEKSIGRIIVGLPLTLKNTFSEQTKKTNVFVEMLKSKIDIPIKTYDERLSSIEAKKSLIKQGVKTGHDKESVDMTAAAIFLQSYLNENSRCK